MDLCSCLYRQCSYVVHVTFSLTVTISFQCDIGYPSQYQSREELLKNKDEKGRSKTVVIGR